MREIYIIGSFSLNKKNKVLCFVQGAFTQYNTEFSLSRCAYLLSLFLTNAKEFFEFLVKRVMLMGRIGIKCYAVEL